mmetsp:Transcript_26066/g.60119  ORF Transcript_26066/g.60119 Transcript_26066/m.60119 type:complete len:181 (-) Transcript_26066:252-794(-)
MKPDQDFIIDSESNDVCVSLQGMCKIAREYHTPKTEVFMQIVYECMGRWGEAQELGQTERTGVSGTLRDAHGNDDFLCLSGTYRTKLRRKLENVQKQREVDGLGALLPWQVQRECMDKTLKEGQLLRVAPKKDLHHGPVEEQTDVRGALFAGSEILLERVQAVPCCQVRVSRCVAPWRLT